MGNSQSISPELKIYKAVDKGDSQALQRILQEFSSRAPDFDRTILEYRDDDGRTPLMVAAMKNHQRCVQLLLQYGANVHLVNTFLVVRGGTALHEAARAGNAAVCELLLAYGANAFIANAVNRTPLDEAMVIGSYSLAARLREGALWRGNVTIKSTKLAGLSKPHKSRYMMVLPHYPCPKEGSTEPVRRQLWIFKDNKEVNPRTRLWLDGATAFRTTGGDAIIRLHPSHSEPQGGLATRYDRGWCLFLRPATGTDAARADLETLLALASPQGVQSVQPGSLPLSEHSSSNLAALQPPGVGPRLPTPPGTPGSTGAPTSAGGTPLLATLGPSPGPLTQGLPPRGGSAPLAGPTGGRRVMSDPPAGGPGPHHAPHHSWSHSPGPLLTGGQGTQAPASNPQQQQFTTSQGVLVSDAWVDTLHALPGESDAEFAARLASAISVGGGTDQEAALGARAGPTGGSTTAARVTSAPGGIAGARPLSGTHQGTQSASSTLLGGSANLSPVPVRPSSPSLGTRPASSPAFPMPEKADAAPSAPPATPPAGRDDNDNQCIICLSAPREVGFLHGASVHKCVCRSCAPAFRVGVPCPLCRARVERVLDIFE